MKSVLALLSIILSILILGCDNNSTNQEIKEEVVNQLTEEELKAQLKQKECNNPNDYLSGKLNWKGKYKNALSLKINRITIDCNISNKATLATYKDVNCNVKFISKTGSTVIEDEFVIYEFFKPNKTVSYKTDIKISHRHFKDIQDIEWRILKAKCN